MEKVFNNEGSMRTRLKKAKTSRVYYDLPDIVIDASGVHDNGTVRIQTLADFEAYCNNHKDVVDFLMQNYSKDIAAIYRNAMTELSDPKSETNISKILSGQPVKSNFVYQAAYAPSARSTVRGFLNTFNASKSGVLGVDVQLPRFKKTKKQIMKMFETEKGYFVPEINAEGLVVSKDSGKFNTNFTALSEEELARDYFFNNLEVPFGEFINKVGIKSEDIIRLSGEEVTEEYLRANSEVPFKDVINTVCINFEDIIALSKENLARQCLLEYFKAPYGNKADEMGIDFNALIDLSKKAYEQIGKSDMAKAVSNLVDTCAETYPLDFYVKGKRVKNVGISDSADEIVSEEVTNEVLLDEITDESLVEGLAEETTDESLAEGLAEEVTDETLSDEIADTLLDGDDSITDDSITDDSITDDGIVDEIRIEGDGSSIRPGIEGGEVVITITADAGVVYRYVSVYSSKVKDGNGKPMHESKSKRCLVIKTESEPSERE